MSFHDKEIVVGKHPLEYHRDKAVIANTIYGKKKKSINNHIIL